VETLGGSSGASSHLSLADVRHGRAAGRTTYSVVISPMMYRSTRLAGGASVPVGTASEDSRREVIRDPKHSSASTSICQRCQGIPDVGHPTLLRVSLTGSLLSELGVYNSKTLEEHGGYDLLRRLTHVLVESPHFGREHAILASLRARRIGVESGV
jgi:hypothetical protein